MPDFCTGSFFCRGYPPYARLLDHLVGEVEHAWRYGEAERPGGLQVDDQRVFCRLLNREVGRTGAPEDAVEVGCRLRVQLDRVEPVGHQATSSGKLGRADIWQTVTGCGGDDHIAMSFVKTVWQTDQATSWLARLGGDGFLDRRVVVHRSERHRHPERRGGGLDRAVWQCGKSGVR